MSASQIWGLPKQPKKPGNPAHLWITYLKLWIIRLTWGKTACLFGFSRNLSPPYLGVWFSSSATEQKGRVGWGKDGKSIRRFPHFAWGKHGKSAPPDVSYPAGSSPVCSGRRYPRFRLSTYPQLLLHTTIKSSYLG
jgi:hypothetical protein